ncbi:MAG: Clp protease [Bacteroidia bacterium]|nr:MAG: Clp protease [Bacteroidia bacterium]
MYLMTVGGDCFQANEIVNILNEVFGSYTAEGGAIVASAGTYIAINATSFVFAKNGQFMIHKPHGGAYGNDKEVESYLKLLQNMTAIYYAAYVEKCTKPEKELSEKWESGDFWMTAKEAKEWGFVTEIKEAVKVTKALAAQIKKSGSPIAFAQTDIIVEPNNIDMDLKAMAVAAGLDANATEAEVNARIKENAEKASKYDTLKADTERKEKEEKAKKIKAFLDEKENQKVINATNRTKWQQLLEADFEGNKVLLDDMKPVQKLSAEIKTSADGTGATYQGKTFEQLQDENPEALAELEETNPEAYDALFADWKKRNQIK